VKLGRQVSNSNLELKLGPLPLNALPRVSLGILETQLKPWLWFRKFLFYFGPNTYPNYSMVLGPIHGL